MKWKCPVYGSVVFYGRKIPERWPSGVLADERNESTKTWRYEDNLIEGVDGFEFKSSEDSIRVLIFKF